MFPLETATTKAFEYLEKANQYAKEDAECCKNYLKAVQSAVRGLEEECDQILIQSRHINLEQPEEVRQLSIRIDQYLLVDRLRLALQTALTGLEDYRKTLQDNAERFLQWPWRKEKKQKAIQKFTELLIRLNLYLEALGQEHLKHRNSGTGVFVQQLIQIRYYLDSEPNKNLQKEFFDYVNKVLQHRDKKKLLDDTSKIEKTVNALLFAFR